MSTRVCAGGSGHIWDQTTLARTARDGVLLSLANAGPLRHTAHVLCLHDAHLYDMPEAFSRGYRAVHRFLRPRLARRARGLITVSRHSAQQLAAHLDVPETRFEIVPNSADHCQFWPHSVGAVAKYGLAPKTYLLTLGNQTPNKNIGALIKAHALAGPDVPSLVIAGGAAPGLASVTQSAARVHVLGRVPDEDLRALYEGAAGFVFPSLNEGFGIPPLEAMQLGVPVLCAKAGAMPDVLQDAPMWFDPLSIEDMAGKLVLFSGLSPADLEEKIRLGHQTAAQYSWAKNAAKLMAVLERVQAETQRARSPHLASQPV